MPAQVPAGIGPPTQLLVPILAGTSGLDLTLVTGVSFNVQRGDGSIAAWSASILSAAPPSAQGGSSLVAAHTFAPSDTMTSDLVPQPIYHNYWVQAVLTTPQGQVPCYARLLRVTDSFKP